MLRTTTLAAYSIKVWNVEEKEEEPVSDFGDSSDLLKFFLKILSKLKAKTSDNKTSHQVLTVRDLKQEERTLFGVIETGEYGMESNIWSTESHKVVHTKKTTEAELLPFYFLIYVPEGPNEAILLLQRSGTFGIRKILQELFTPTFEDEFQDYRVRFNPLIEADEIDKYVKGKVQSIRFIRFGIPSDIADAYDEGHTEVKGRIELVIRARRGSYLPLNNRLKQFFTGKKQLSALIALDETKFNYENIKVKSQVGGGTRTLDLANPKHLRSYHDISSSVKLDKGGHPKLDSIHALALELLERIKKQMYPGGLQ